MAWFIPCVKRPPLDSRGPLGAGLAVRQFNSREVPPMNEEAVAQEYEKLRGRLQAKGLGGEVGFGDHPALVVVDFALGFTDSRSPLAANLDAEIEATRSLLAAARASETPVIFSTVAYDPDGQDMGVWVRKIPANRTLIAGSEWVGIDERLQRRQDEAVLVKKYASCFFGTDLTTRLLAHGVDTVILCGCTTSGCVRATAVDACSYGFRTIVVEDASGDRSSLPHMSSLFDIQAKYGDVVRLPTAVDYLDGLAAKRPLQ
ncbi:MAG TPA: N-carbamoylsarcosine amidohydrolase [Nocardioidaceae bacterium]|nr:N-carbamoylsarcosine amidohydrolase [Nocardioidaceae bacterium]